MTSNQSDTCADIQQRLNHILDEVSDSSISLDDALTLCEEAVALGLSASALLENNITQEELDSQTVSCSPLEQDTVAE